MLLNHKPPKPWQPLQAKLNKPFDKYGVAGALGDAEASLNPIGWGVNDDDMEWHGIIEELIEYFDIIRKAKTEKQMTKRITDFIAGLSWDNFRDDEAEDEAGDGVMVHYSLGSMYYNKLSWISEGSSNEKALYVANMLKDTIAPVMDYTEKHFYTDY